MISSSFGISPKGITSHDVDVLGMVFLLLTQRHILNGKWQQKSKRHQKSGSFLKQVPNKSTAKIPASPAKTDQPVDSTFFKDSNKVLWAQKNKPDPDCCIFWPAFGCCTLQTVVEICFFMFFCTKSWKKKKMQAKLSKMCIFEFTPKLVGRVVGRKMTILWPQYLTVWHVITKSWPKIFRSNLIVFNRQ